MHEYLHAREAKKAHRIRASVTDVAQDAGWVVVRVVGGSGWGGWAARTLFFCNRGLGAATSSGEGKWKCGSCWAQPPPAFLLKHTAQHPRTTLYTTLNLPHYYSY